MAMVDVDGSSHLSADSQPKSVGLVWGLAATQRSVCIHQMNQVKSRSDHGYEDSTINIVVELLSLIIIITFCVSRRRRKMYCGHLCLCVCQSVRGRMPHYCTDPDVTWRSGRGCPLVVHYWADLQLVHGLRSYGNTMEICMTETSSNPSGLPHATRTTHACGEDSPHRR